MRAVSKAQADFPAAGCRLLRLAAAVLCLSVAPAIARAADAAADAVSALAQLTDPARLAILPDDDAFRAQLGPALGWLQAGRRRDVSPEAILARAFALNGTGAARAELTRAALLRNLSRADGWELFKSEQSARALAYGQAPVIQAGIHRGHLAQTVVVAAGQSGAREFFELQLLADDEPPPRPPPTPAHPRASHAAPAHGNPGRPRLRQPPPPPIEYDEPLPQR